MKVEVDVLGSPSLIVCTVSVDIKQHEKKKKKKLYNRVQKLCERRDTGPSSLILSPYDFCGRKATKEEEEETVQ